MKRLAPSHRARKLRSIEWCINRALDHLYDLRSTEGDDYGLDARLELLGTLGIVRGLVVDNKPPFVLENKDAAT